MPDVTLHTPRGVRDLLPDAARNKALIEGRLSQHFGSWGYDPVATPTFELFDVLRLVEGARGDESLYRFVDREGSMIALRPEMTVPIARLVTSRLREQPMPLRLQYTGSVFRYDEPQSGRLREFTQAGLELIGAPGPEADAEVIALTITALIDLGLNGFRMDLGHVGFAASVLDGLGLSADALVLVRRSLLRQDYVALDQILHTSGASAQARHDLHELVALRGDAHILERAAALARTDKGRDALNNVSAVYRHLEAHGVAGWVRLDLGMVKHLDYYTGIVLEGYTSDLGYTLCTGGRYDRLLQRFGCDLPATGLAIGVERLLLALHRAGAEPMPTAQRVLFITSEARRAEACSVAWRLRQQGLTVELDVLGLDRQAAQAYASKRQIADVVVFEGALRSEVERLVGGQTQRVAVDDLLDRGGRGL